MTEVRTNSSRRAFFLQGGAALGAGAATIVASTVTGCALAQEDRRSSDGQLKELRRQLDLGAAREAIRDLHVAFMALLESQAYDAAVELFDEEAYLHLGGAGAGAGGKVAIRRLFSEQYRGQNGAAIHSAYRQSASQQNDTVTLSDDRLQASATLHVEAELCAPLQGDCTAAQMARLQGQVASRSWEAGRFEARYVKTSGKWQVLSLVYVSA